MKTKTNFAGPFYPAKTFDFHREQHITVSNSIHSRLKESKIGIVTDDNYFQQLKSATVSDFKVLQVVIAMN